MNSTATLSGHAADLAVYEWEGSAPPSYIALLCHGYGEHMGRYDWLARQLVEDGAAVFGIDHLGHGRSGGERVLIEDVEPVVADFGLLEEHARARHPQLPVVVIGHSMGGMIATRYAQTFGDGLSAVVLSGPVLGRWPIVEDLLPLETIPPTPVDPETLSRDPQVQEDYAQDPLVWHGDFKRDTLKALQRCLNMISLGGTVGDLPLLHLHGDEDELVPPEPSKAGVREIAGEATEQRFYPGARHEIFNETNKEEVLGDVLTFLHRRVPLG